MLDYGSIDIGSNPIKQTWLWIYSSMAEQLTFNQFVEGSNPFEFIFLGLIT